MKGNAAMCIALVLLGPMIAHSAPVSAVGNTLQPHLSGLSLAQHTEKQDEGKKNIPVVKHNKIKGGKYAEGSALYNKQQNLTGTKAALKAEEKADEKAAIAAGHDKVLLIFCILGFIFFLVVYAMFQVQVRGKEINPNFTNAVNLTLRVGVFAFILASLVWFPPLEWLTTADFRGKIPLVICLYFFTVSPILGTTIANAWAGAIGTFWAFLQMWIMNGIFPGGMAPGMGPASATAIFGWVNFFLFLFLILWSKCTIGTKMFALANAIGFMLAFLNPDSTVKFSEGFKIDPHGTAFNTLIATWIACLVSPLVNLFPSVLTSAFMSMKGNSMNASKTTAKLFEDVVEYYGGRVASVKIEVHIKQASNLRGSIDSMAGSVGAAWWECFDMGKYGTIRALMEAHAGMMGDLHDRLKATLIAASTEQFEASHVRVMESILGRCREVVKVTGELLNFVTEAASDGVFEASERQQMQVQIAKCKDAVRALARDYDVTRRNFRTPINSELLGESFFVFTLSAYARIVWEYAEMMLTGPPKGDGAMADIMTGVKATWSGLLDRDNLFFTLKHFCALSFCWFYAIYVQNFSGTCVITAVFLMNKLACPDVQGLLNAMNAVILAAVVGSLVFEWSCESGHGMWVMPFLTLAIWLGGLFGVYSGSRFATACIFIVALIPFKLIVACPPEGSNLAGGAAGVYQGMIGFVLAILFVAGFQYMLARDRASNLALASLSSAFSGMKLALNNFWVKADMKGPLSSVGGDLATGAGCSASAAIEPRFFRYAWNHRLYMDVVASLQILRLDLLMLWHALAGKKGEPENIFARFSNTPEFQRVCEDLTQTFDDSAMICTNMLAHTGGILSGLQDLKTKTGIDSLEALPSLIDSINRGGIDFPRVVGETMEDDDICQISAILLMLDNIVKHVAIMMVKPIKQI